MTKYRMTKGQQRIGFKRRNHAEMYASNLSSLWLGMAIDKHRRNRSGQTEVFFACGMYTIADSLRKYTTLVFGSKLYYTKIDVDKVNDIICGLQIGLSHLEHTDENRGIRERVKNMIYLLNQGIYTNKERLTFCESLRTVTARG